MLRIDESSKTLVTPQQGGFEPEPPLERSELLALVGAGWPAFAQELGQTHLHLVAVEPAPGVDLLAFDDASGRVVVMLVGGSEPAAALLGRAVVAAAQVAGWDAARLAGVHETLQAAVPGDSPRVLLLGGPFDPELVAAVDWLTRRHGMELNAHDVRMLRFGSERLMQVSRVYPAAPADPAAHQAFFADVMAAPSSGPAGPNSAPPPAASPVPAPPAV